MATRASARSGQARVSPSRAQRLFRRVALQPHQPYPAVDGCAGKSFPCRYMRACDRWTAYTPGRCASLDVVVAPAAECMAPPRIRPAAAGRTVDELVEHGRERFMAESSRSMIRPFCLVPNARNSRGREGHLFPGVHETDVCLGAQLQQCMHQLRPGQTAPQKYPSPTAVHRCPLALGVGMVDMHVPGHQGYGRNN